MQQMKSQIQAQIRLADSLAKLRAQGGNNYISFLFFAFSICRPDEAGAHFSGGDRVGR